MGRGAMGTLACKHAPSDAKGTNTEAHAKKHTQTCVLTRTPCSSWGMAGADVRLMGPSGHPLGTFLHQHQPYPQQQEQQHYQQQQQEQSQPVPFTSPSTGAPRHSQSAPLPYGPPSPSSSSTATVPRGRGGMIGLGGTMGFLPVTNRGDNPPCNTLFVGNLSDTVSARGGLQMSG
eukprot:scaffold106090_cov16-Tisochrysis_lutea.AAC.1